MAALARINGAMILRGEHMKIRNIALVGVAAWSLAGCATVMNGVNQPIEFQTDPDGAIVRLTGDRSCTTPCEFELRRGNDLRVDITKEGYRSEFVYINSRMGGATFGNILAGGVVGAVVDGSNGASNHLYPDPVYIRLVPTGSSEPALLLDEDGEVISTLAEHNAAVEADVLEGIANGG